MGWREDLEYGGTPEPAPSPVGEQGDWRTDLAYEGPTVPVTQTVEYQQAMNERARTPGANPAVQDYNLRTDFDSFAEGDIERVRDLRSVVRLIPSFLESDDEEVRGYANQLLGQFKDHDSFRDVLATEFGEAYFDDVYEGPSALNQILGTGMSALDTLAAPFKGISGSVGILTADPGAWRQALATLGRGGGELVDQFIPGYNSDNPGDLLSLGFTEEQVAALTQGDGVIDPFDWFIDGKRLEDRVRSLPGMEAGVDIPGPLGTLDMAGVLDFATQVLYDPLTYVGVGQGRRAAAGLGLLDQAGPRTKIIADRLRSGAKWADLDDVDQALARSIWDDAGEVAARRAVRSGTEGGEAALAKIRKEQDRIRAAVAKRYESNVVRRAGGGVFFAGMRVPGTRRLASRGYRALNQTRWVNKPILTVADEAGEIIAFTGDDVLDILPEDEVAAWLRSGEIGTDIWETNLAVRSIGALAAKGNIDNPQALRMLDEVVERATEISLDHAEKLREIGQEAIGFSIERRLPRLRRLGGSWRPRAGLRADQGARVADEAGLRLTALRGFAGQERDSVVARLSRLPQRVADDLGAERWDEINARLGQIVSDQADPERIVKLRELTDELSGQSEYLDRLLAATDDILTQEDELLQLAKEADAPLGATDGISEPSIVPDIALEDVWETPFEQVVAQNTYRAAWDAADQKMIMGLAEVIGEDGLPLVRLMDEGAEGAGVRIGRVGDQIAYAPKSVADELQKVRTLFRDRTDMDLLRRAFDEVSTLWASTVTSALINPNAIQFNMRNAMGNMLNSFLAGMKNPRRLRQAMSMQRRWGKAWDEVAETGMSIEDVLRQSGDEQADILLGAIENDVISSSFFSTLGEDAERLTRIGARLQSLSGANVGRKIASDIENNARLALFIDQVEKGFTYNDAALTVKKHLFDYSDLTKFEFNVIRPVSRFYTFMRKNTPLQIEAAVRTPGRVANAERLRRGYEEAMWGPEDEDQGIVPDYLYRAGARSRGGNIVLAESPFLAAGDIVEVGLAAPNIFPGGTGVLSAVGIEPVPEQEAWQGVLSLFSGAPIEAVKTTVEGATGRDSFTGGPLRNDAAGKFFRWADATVPAITRIAQRGEQFGFWEAGLVKEDQEGEIAARLLSMVTGVQHTLNNEGFQDRQLDYMRRDFEELLEQAMELDPTIPTVEEMREAGRLQEANRVLGAMLYAQPEEGETFEQAQIRRLRDLLPRAVAEQFGIPKDEITSEQTLADYINKAGEVRQLLNALGVEPTDEDVALLVANLPGGPSNALLEQLGIQGNQDNLFGRVTESPLERAAREQRELDEATAQLNAFSEIYGLSPERIAEIRPWLAEAERIVADARAFGLPQDELNAYLVSELLSRQDRMWIGIHGIEDLAKYERYEDAERDAEQAWNDLLNLSVVNRELGLGMSYEEIQILMYWSQLSGAEQDALGIPRQPSLPGREDLRSEQEIAEDILAEFFAVEQGRSRFEALAGN